MKNKYRVKGDTVVIQLRRRKGPNLYTRISLRDLDKVQIGPTNWYAHYISDMNAFYVRADLYETGDSKRRRIYMHRILTGAPVKMLVDHWNYDTLDNRFENLRVVSKSENMHNLRSITKSNTTGYQNVSYDKRRGKFVAFIIINRKYKFLGYFDDAQAASETVLRFRQENNLGGSRHGIPNTQTR